MVIKDITEDITSTVFATWPNIFQIKYNLKMGKPYFT